MKIRPVGAELFRADRQTDRRADGQTWRADSQADGHTASVQTDREAGGRTDMAKLIVAFRNFANAPKKKGIMHSQYRSDILDRTDVSCTVRNVQCAVPYVRVC